MKKLLLLALFPVFAYAGGSHHTVEQTIIIQNTTERVIEKVSQKGVALGIATSQLIFDASTSKTQIAAGVGVFDESDAIAVGLAKKVDNLMLIGSIGWEDGRKGYGAGVSFKF